jgi:hypothetical protein
MTAELKTLGWSVVLGLVYVMVAAALGTQQRGLKWNAGARDGDPQPRRTRNSAPSSTSGPGCCICRFICWAFPTCAPSCGPSLIGMLHLLQPLVD